MVFLIFLVWFSQQWFKKGNNKTRSHLAAEESLFFLAHGPWNKPTSLSLCSLSAFSSLFLVHPTHTAEVNPYFSLPLLEDVGDVIVDSTETWPHTKMQTHTHTHARFLSLCRRLSLSLPHCFVASVSSVPQLSVTNWCCGTFPFCSLSIKLAERCSTAEFNFTVELGCWLPCQTQINARLTNMDQETPGWQPASACWPTIEGHETGASQQPPPHLPQSDWLKEFTPCNYTPSQHIRAPPPTLSVLVGFSLCTCVCVSLWKKEK